MTGWGMGRFVLKVVCQFKTFRLISIMHTLFNIWLLNKVLKRDMLCLEDACGIETGIGLYGSIE